jgi:hypothetical protein
MLSERFDKFFRTAEQKDAEADEIVSLLKDSSHLAELRRARDEKRLNRIRELLAQREQFNREHGAKLPGLEAAVIEAQEKEKAAHAAVETASRERVNAEHARLCQSLDFDFNARKLRDELEKLAPAEINDFIYEMVKADEEARREAKFEQQLGPKARITGEVKNVIFKSNRDAVDKKRASIKAAITEAESMKLQAISYDQIIARLAELKAAVAGKCDWFEEADLPLPDVRELQRPAN